MSFDSTCKFIAETFSQDIAAWLLGVPIPLTKLEPSELSVEPIRADSVLFLESEDLLFQIEFQTDPDPDMPFRMADYRLRGYRRYSEKAMRQVVVYLRATESRYVYQTVFELPMLRHEFEVLRLYEQPTETFLLSEGLLPFAVLTSSEEARVQVLRQVARQIDEISDRQAQANLAAASSILAGLILDKETIHQVLRRDLMRESVIYQEIESEAQARGIEKGMAKGMAQGKIEEGRSLILRLLARKLGEVTAEQSDQVRALSLEMLEQLGDDLLDFQSQDDLLGWFEKH